MIMNFRIHFLLATFAAISTTALAASPGVLRVAFDADPVSLDPHEQLSGGTLQLSHLCFDPLLRWNRDLELQPRLASSWKRIDERTMRFSLRKGVLFHSGNPLTATDVKWTFDRLQTSRDFKGLFAPIAKLAVIDDHTFDLVTTELYPLLLNVATYIFPMDRLFYAGEDSAGNPKDAIIKHGSSFASRNLSGTGPFIITKREQGIRVDFKRSETYWDVDSPGNVQTLRLTPIKEDVTRVAALLSGEIDFIAPVPTTELKRLQGESSIAVETMTGTRLILLQLNQDRHEAFKDARVRRAINLAINNDGIARIIMGGFATPAGQMSPPGYAGHQPDRAPEYDLKTAQSLMKQAGYAKGFTVSMMAPNNRYVNDDKIAVAVVNMLKRLDIKVELRTLPKAQYWPEFDKQSADIMMIGWHADTEDSANFIEFLAMTRDNEKGLGQYNNANYSNPIVDDLVLQSQRETDPAKRATILKEAEGILIDEAAFIPLHWQDLAWAARKPMKIRPILNVMNFPYFGDLVLGH